jgi:hypothetical protein
MPHTYPAKDAVPTGPLFRSPPISVSRAQAYVRLISEPQDADIHMVELPHTSILEAVLLQTRIGIFRVTIPVARRFSKD